MANVVLTGAGGFVGSHIASALIKHNHSVCAFMGPGDSYSPPEAEIQFIDLVNLENEASLRQQLNRCDWLIHVAGPSSVSDSFTNPDLFMQTHSVGTSTVMRLANETGVKKRIYISSAEVYGASVDYPITEEEKCSPKSPYGVAKYSAEWIARVLSNASSSDLIIIRPFSLYGSRMRAGGVMQRIIDQVKQGEKVELFNLSPVRDNLYIKDLATMMCNIIQQDLSSNILNACSGEGVSIGELANIISSIFQVEIPITQSTTSDRPVDTHKLVGCRNKSVKTLAWEPEYSLKTGIEDMLGLQ